MCICFKHSRHRLIRDSVILLAGASMLLSVPLRAQESSLYKRDFAAERTSSTPGPLNLRTSSWTFSPDPLPREFRVHDIVTIRVNELAQATSEGEVERRKNALYDALLSDWVVLNGLKSVKPSPQSDGDPRIRGQLQQLNRAEGEVETRQSLALNVSAEVVDIRPNHTLVLEAHNTVQVNDEAWEVSLTGICRPEDIDQNNRILSEKILNLHIYKRERGHVRDSYKRGWFVRWFDEFNPF